MTIILNKEEGFYKCNPFVLDNNSSFDTTSNSYVSLLMKRSLNNLKQNENPPLKKNKSCNEVYFTTQLEKVEIQTTKIFANGQFKKLYPAVFWNSNNEPKNALFAKFMEPKESMVKRELYILNKLKTSLPGEIRGICISYGSCKWDSKNGQKQAFVFPFYNGGTLANSKKINKKDSLKIALDVAYGLKKIHQLNIVHNDLKPENICLKKNEDTQELISAHIIDFGLGLDLSNEKENFPFLSNRHWGSPESNQFAQIKNNENINPMTAASDIYSYGKILEFLCFDTDDICELMQDALSEDPNDRPTIDEFIKVLENRYTKKYA